MSLFVFLAVIAAALLHATWNALIKVGRSRIGAMFIMSVVEIPLGLALLFLAPPMRSESIPWLLAGGVAHFLNKTALAYAYDSGDLTRVFPIARGAGILLVTIIGAMVLTDHMSLAQYATVVALAIGTGIMARGVYTQGEDRLVLVFAMCSAVATAGYIMFDGIGARISGSAFGFAAWVFIVDGILFATGTLLLRGRGVVPLDLHAWKMGGIASFALLGGYAVPIWAMTQAPIALVAALRETSVFFALMIGWLIFHERMTTAKITASAIIVAGMVLSRL